MTRAGDRGADTRVHTDACNGGHCPCYVQGQLDVVMAIRTLQRLGMPLDGVLATVEVADAEHA